MSDETQAAEAEAEGEPRVGVFRKAAVDAMKAPRRAVGDIVRISPRWLRLSYWVVVLALVSVVTLALTARVNEFSRGPAVIVASDKVAMTAPLAGVVSRVPVRVGDVVTAGTVVVQFADASERAELERIDAQFEQQLARTLIDRADRVARDSLVSLKAARAAASTRLDERQVRAPVEGRVVDIRVRPGDYAEAGALLVTLASQRARFQVLALLPGPSRPDLTVGMPLRLELEGFPFEYQTLRVASVGGQVIGPAEARRTLGLAASDSFELTGTLAVVTAELESDSFQRGDERVEYADGMAARAEVPLRQVRLIYLLAPWLRRLR